MYYQDISSIELEKYLKKRQDIIIPFGAVELHGAHLPYFTDVYIIEGILKEFSKRNAIMIAPTIFYTITRNIEKTFGTVTMDFDSAKNYYIDIFESFIRHGLKKLYPMTYHASVPHLTSIAESSREARKKYPGVLFNGVHLWNIIRKKGRQEGILESKQEEVHAGEIETSLMLYLKPKLVKKSKAVDEKIRLDQFNFISGLKLNQSTVFGQAKLASKTKGKKLIKIAVRELLKILK